MPQTRKVSNLDDDGLICLAKNEKPCQFPFKLYGKVINSNIGKDMAVNFQVYTSCTTDYTIVPWCSTQGLKFDLYNLLSNVLTFS